MKWAATLIYSAFYLQLEPKNPKGTDSKKIHEL